MRYNLIVPFLVFFLLSNVALSCAENLIATGCSVSNVAYLSGLAREYEKETGTRISVLGGGSLRGLMDLTANRVDFAASCKGWVPGDRDDFEFIPVAQDALVFIVNKSNPVNNITVRRIRDIYDGKITNWKQLGGPDLMLQSFISTPEGMGGVGQSLTEMVLKGKKPVQHSNSVMLPSSAALSEQGVEITPGGFASTGFGSARKRNVKMLKVNGVEATKKNIMSGKYPFKRPLYLVIKKNSKPEVRKFVDFALSKKGQGLISSYGIPSLADVK